jgi:hypothetical protein
MSRGNKNTQSHSRTRNPLQAHSGVTALVIRWFLSPVYNRDVPRLTKLEVQLDRQLDLPGGGGSIRPGKGLSRQSKGSRVLNHISWLTKLGMVQHIKEFRADLHPETLRDAHTLHQYRIGIGVIRAIKLVSTRVT